MFLTRAIDARFLAAFLVAACALPAAAAAPATPAAAAPGLPRVEDFFTYPRFFSPKLSPDGKMVAVVTGVPRGRTTLTVIALSTDKVFSAATIPDANVALFHWVSNTRLVYASSNPPLAAGEKGNGPGLYSVNFDGRNFQRLAEQRGDGRDGFFDSTMPSWTAMLSDPGAQDSNAIWVTVSEPAAHGARPGVDLYRLDTAKGERTKFEPPFVATSWMLDETGEPRLATTTNGPIEQIQVRDRASGEWRALPGALGPGGRKVDFNALAFGPDGTLYVSSALGKDKQSVHTLDIASGKINEQAVITTTDYDFAGKLIIANNKLLGFRLLTDAESTI